MNLQVRLNPASGLRTDGTVTHRIENDCASQQILQADFRNGSIASVRVCWPYARSYRDSDRNSDLRARRLSAKTGREQPQQIARYSITSSAIAMHRLGALRLA
jgi:hypothetical protein